MPTTKAKNWLYRCMLPLCSPSVGKDPVVSVQGHSLVYQDCLSSLIRKHHMTGETGLVGDGDDAACFFGRSFHTDLVPDEKTYYRVASITKMAVALLAFVLSDRGLLDLNAPLAFYLPDCSGVKELEGVTAQHLLSHTSGLSDPPDLEKMLLHSLPLQSAVAGRRFAEPGSSFRYSNLGFGLLGCLYESILDQPVGRAFDRLIFGPLGMRATLEGCTLPEEQIMPVVRVLPWRSEQAVTITALGRVPLGAPDPIRHYGHTAGSMYTDLPSLLKLLLCIREGGAPLISDPSFSMLRRKASYGKISPTLSYASGLIRINDPSLSASPVYGHQGFAYGCADGAFWEAGTGRILIQLNGGCSEARVGRLALANVDFLRWAFRKELPSW